MKAAAHDCASRAIRAFGKAYPIDTGRSPALLEPGMRSP